MNVRGASALQIQGAVRSISSAGGAEAWLRRVADEGLTLELPKNPDAYWRRRGGRERPFAGHLAARSPGIRVLCDRGSLGGDHAYLQMCAAALERALHAEAERRALEGELSALREMWREAEEIAAIADRLPDVPAPTPPRLG